MSETPCRSQSSKNIEPKCVPNINFPASECFTDLSKSNLLMAQANLHYCPAGSENDTWLKSGQS